MPDQFVRFRAIGVESIGVGKLAGHKRCQTRNPHTTEGPRAGIKPVPLVNELDCLEAALMAIDRDARARFGEPGRRPAGCYDVLMTGAPRYDGLNGGPLSEEDERKWATACIVWLRSVVPPGTIIANAYLHRDEASPHVHVTIVPWNEESQRIDWRTCRARMAGVEPRARLSFDGLLSKTKEVEEDGTRLRVPKTEEELKADKTQAGRIRAADKRASGKEMTAILDSFHTRVSEPFGIGRGDRGNRRRHRKVDHRKALDLEVEGAELQARVSAEREAMAKASADAAELAAREEEARAAKALKDWAQGERESKRLQRENEDLAKKNEEGAATYAQVVADIETGREGSAAGRAQREELERRRTQGEAWTEERMRLKLALGVPQDELPRVLGLGEVRELVDGVKVAERDSGRSAVWNALRRFVKEFPGASGWYEQFADWFRGSGQAQAPGRSSAPDR